MKFNWKNILETETKLYPSTIEMQNRVKNICYQTSVLNEEAFCALASNGGNIEETIESLKDADFFNSVRTACNVFDVRKYALENKRIKFENPDPKFWWNDGEARTGTVLNEYKQTKRLRETFNAQYSTMAIR